MIKKFLMKKKDGIILNFKPMNKFLIRNSLLK